MQLICLVKKVTLSFLKSFAKTFIFEKSLSCKDYVSLQRQKYYKEEVVGS